MIKKIGILTSGGDAPGMNAAIRAITKCALISGLEVVGIKNGYKGLHNGEFIPFSRANVAETIDRGGTILGSARFPEFKDSKVQEEAVSLLKENEIDALIVIGGDGTYRGAIALMSYGINCIGLPGTIDNDIPGTDFTIGFDTALNTIVECIDKLRDTSASHHRCSVVEVMGNHCGDLAVWAGISGGAEILVTSRTEFNEREIIERLKFFDSLGKNHAIVIVSEKVTDVNALAQAITDNTSFAARAAILGHLQRGGHPTAHDRVLASRMGEKAVELLLSDVWGHCVGIIDNHIVSTPIEEVFNSPHESAEGIYDLFKKLV